ncbi:MAG: hypothetical protein K9L86_04335 [Candidatus Omnitrophica bacterium]|nr:hypothetical protein [Candidatus Omnitrophota bacterium]
MKINMPGEGLDSYAYGMWPVLVSVYYKLAMREEKEVEKQFDWEFLEYRKRVPAFIPGLKKEA